MFKYLLILLFPYCFLGQDIVEEVEVLINKKEYTKAEYILNGNFNDPPKKLDKLEDLGDVFLKQNKWEEAEFIFEKLIIKDANNADYHYKYGQALGMKALKGNMLFAFFMKNDIHKEFLLATKLDTTHIDARWALVIYYTELPGFLGGSLRKALDFSEELQLLSPVDGYLSKGYIYEYDEEIGLAEENYIKAIQVGGSIICYKKLISFYTKNNESKKAISTIEEAYKKLNLNSLNYLFGEVSADFNIELKKGKKSLFKYIDNFSSEDERSIEWAYLKLAQIYRHEEDKVNALKWVNQAIEIQNNFDLAIKEKELILNM